MSDDYGWTKMADKAPPKGMLVDFLMPPCEGDDYDDKVWILTQARSWDFATFYVDESKVAWRPAQPLPPWIFSCPEENTVEGG